MQFRVLLLAALSVPSASAFDVRLLSTKFLGPLPEDFARLVRYLKASLIAYPAPHFGLEKERWDLGDVCQFDEYFLTLKELVILAVRHPKLLFGAQDSEKQPLAQVLEHLLSTDDSANLSPFNVVTEQSECALSLMIARADYMVLREFYRAFYFHHRKDFDEAHNSPLWLIEASTFETVAETCSGVWSIITSLIKRIYWTSEESDYRKMMLHSIADIPILTQRLEQLTEKLPESFCGLQAAVKRLAEAECGWSWVEKTLPLWKDALGLGTELITQLWSQQDMRISECVILEEFAKAGDRFRVKLAVGVIPLLSMVLQLQAPKEMTLEEAEVRSRVQGWLETSDAPLTKMSADIQAFVATQIDQMDNVLATGGVSELEMPGYTSMSNLASHIQGTAYSLTIGLSRSIEAANLDPETVTALNNAYALAKQVVNAYGALLDLGRRRLMSDDEFDALLKRVLLSCDSRTIFVNAMYLVKRIEDIEGVVDPENLYEQEIYTLPQVFGRLEWTKNAKDGIPPAEAIVGEDEQEPLTMEEDAFMDGAVSDDDSPKSLRKEQHTDQ